VSALDAGALVTIGLLALFWFLAAVFLMVLWAVVISK
jgi:hypothetical protein